MPSIYHLPRLGMSEDTSLTTCFNILTDTGNGLCLPLDNIPKAAQYFDGFFDHHTLTQQFLGTVNDGSITSFLSFNCQPQVENHAGITCAAHSEALSPAFLSTHTHVEFPPHVL